MSARYTLILGSKTFSSWSLRPWLAMKMAQTPFEEIVIPLYRDETKARIAEFSPSGRVPALRIEEDATLFTVWDSLAICETLAERHRGAQLWPQDATRRAEARSVSAEMHSGFPDVRKNLPMNVTKELPAPERDEPTDAQVARIVALWESALRRFGNDGGFLFGKFSIADCFYAPVATRFKTYGIALPPAAKAYAQRILDLEPMREWIAAAKTEV